MASLNSVTGTLSSTASLRGYGGLASGLDRDTLIESLTYGTTSKIEAQQAKKEKLQWEQTTIRSMIDKVYNFSETYMSYTSSKNLTESTLFSRTNLSATGEFSKYVSVSGMAKNAEAISILGVKQLASDAKYTGATASASALTTGDIDFTKDIPIDNLTGNYLSVKVGNTTYTADIKDINLEEYKDESTRAKAIADALNKAFADENMSNGKALSTTIEASVVNGEVQIKGIGGNSVELTGGTALSKLGLEKGDISGTAAVVTQDAINKAVTYQSGAEYLAGKTLSFSYNGVSKDIKLGNDINDLDALKKDLQSKLDSAFGKGRIAVATSGNSLSFTTMNVQDGGVDNTSTLSITGGSAGLLGADGFLGTKSGATNRVDLSKSLTEAGLANAGKMILTDIGDGKKGYTMVLNGQRFAFEENTSVQNIINTINKSDSGVTISYSQSTDKFTIASKEKGASGQIEMYGSVAEALFGSEGFTEDGYNDYWKGLSVQGQDAVIAVKYAGDSEETYIYRDSNSFTVDGLNISVSGTFGFENAVDESGNVIMDANGKAQQVLKQDAEAVKIEAKVNADKAVETVKGMIDAFNEVVALINGELKSKPSSDHKNPLTASQKEGMSEDEIKAYEEKAKQGLLFGDSDLRSFSMDLRYVISPADAWALAEIGISESTEYSDNGKLVFDEEKFRAALEKNPEKIDELFNRDAGNGKPAGLMTNMKEVMDKYCKTMGASKGILVERAGSDHSPMSLLDNTIDSEIDEVEDYILKLLDRLEAEEDRYISQFSALETLIAQMNNQSSYLSSLSGY